MKTLILFYFAKKWSEGIKELNKEYKESFNAIKLVKETAEEEEFNIYSEIISDLEFALEWMRTYKRGMKRWILIIS
ncbi:MULTISPECIES: hypothetical protein [Bacillus cereus group]|uniref:hypothetical protein n=1 Tax=Bacillus cereus group TaxID=86661 RepID=UPI001F57856D|nr:MULTISPECIES: hypothetical protein [Bacillus cereus group]MDW3037180.1 hypothetical protein [Bacillus pacificus]